MRIRAPRGTKAIPANNPKGGDGEHEFILHGGAFRIVGVQKVLKGGKALQVLDIELVMSKEGAEHSPDPSKQKWKRRIV